MALKHNVQALGYLDFNKARGPSVMGNPLPNRTRLKINTTLEDPVQGTKVETEEMNESKATLPRIACVEISSTSLSRVFEFCKHYKQPST